MTSSTLSVGMEVEFKRGGRYFPAEVKSVTTEGTYKLRRRSGNQWRVYTVARNDIRLNAVSHGYPGNNEEPRTDASMQTTSNDENEAQMKSGKVARWFTHRGFGFIKPNDGSEDLFVHVSKIEGEHTSLAKGQRVSYLKVHNRMGGAYEATKVTAKKMRWYDPLPTQEKGETRRRRPRTHEAAAYTHEDQVPMCGVIDQRYRARAWKEEPRPFFMSVSADR